MALATWEQPHAPGTQERNERIWTRAVYKRINGRGEQGEPGNGEKSKLVAFATELSRRRTYAFFFLIPTNT